MLRSTDTEFTIDVHLDPEDLEELFEPFDPLRHEVVMPAPRPPRLRGAGTPFEPIDWEYIHKMVEGYLEDVIDHYFRGSVIGAEKLPDEGPYIVAPNHSGNAFPHDAIILDGLLWRTKNYTRKGKFRSVYTPQLAATWWMRPYAIDDWWRRAGGVDMTFVNFDQLLDRGDKVIYYPEGVPGIGKGFTRRYQLQHFHSSFVVLASKHDAPVYPVSVVNAEWVNPTSVTFKPVDEFFKKLLGLPFLPLPIAPLAFLFPFIFYLGFPCRMIFVINDPVDVRQMLREEGCTDLDHPERSTLQRVAQRIREASQRNLDEAVREHGNRPYHWPSLKQSVRQLGHRFLKASPLGWPISFVQNDRDLKRPSANNALHALLRDLDILAWYLPFGWFIAAALRNLRKPPYGYRGLSEQERREREGTYRWSLAERPLPPRDYE